MFHHSKDHRLEADSVVLSKLPSLCAPQFTIFTVSKLRVAHSQGHGEELNDFTYLRRA